MDERAMMGIWMVLGDRLVDLGGLCRLRTSQERRGMAATLVPPGRWTLRHGFVCLATAVVADEYGVLVRLGELWLWSTSCSHINGGLLISRCLRLHALAMVVFVVWMYSIADSGHPRLSLRLVRCACWRVF